MNKSKTEEMSVCRMCPNRYAGIFNNESTALEIAEIVWGFDRVHNSKDHIEKYFGVNPRCLYGYGVEIDTDNSAVKELSF